VQHCVCVSRGGVCCGRDDAGAFRAAIGLPILEGGPGAVEEEQAGGERDEEGGGDRVWNVACASDDGKEAGSPAGSDWFNADGVLGGGGVRNEWTLSGSEWVDRHVWGWGFQGAGEWVGEDSAGDAPPGVAGSIRMASCGRGEEGGVSGMAR
jgi:hypothetical protein